MLTPQQLFDRLAELGIAHQTVEHPPVFTVEEAKAHRGVLPGHHIKNLFLRNKKEEMWLVVALEDRAIDLKALGEKLGAGRLSFGSPERLRKYLGVEPGSVLLDTRDQLCRQVVGGDHLGSDHGTRRDALRLGLVEQHECSLARVGPVVVLRSARGTAGAVGHLVRRG